MNPMRWLVVLMVPFLLLVSPSPSEAWGKAGHRITCEIAYERLTPQARQWVDDLQKGENDSFAETCLWADIVKRTTHPETYNLHFINLAPGAKSLDMKRDCARGDCIVRAIDVYSDQLRDSSLSKDLRRDALKFLAHLMGDVHQPLHCSHLEDLGGNLTLTCFFGHCGFPAKPLNLHHVWDTSLLNRYGEPWREISTRLSGRLSLEAGDLATGGTVLEWANESVRWAEDFVYGELQPWGVDEAYYQGGIRIVERRLMQGAVRLADLLNELAANSQPEPSQK